MLQNRIGEYRKNHQIGGITKAHLARQIRIGRSYMTKIETGSQTPSLEVALNLSKYFKCTVNDLFSTV